MIRKLSLVLFVFVLGCSNSPISNSSIDTSLRTNKNPTTFLSNILYYNDSLALSKKDKSNLDKVAEFTKKYPSSLKIISYNNSQATATQRNNVLKNYLQGKIYKKTVMTFETGGKNENIYNQETFNKDNQFSTRTEIYITY